MGFKSHPLGLRARAFVLVWSPVGELRIGRESPSTSAGNSAFSGYVHFYTKVTKSISDIDLGVTNNI